MKQDTEQELFDLCREVYEKTGWNPPQWFIKSLGSGEYDTTVNIDGSKPADSHKPLASYTSDFLLEKLRTFTVTLMIREESISADVWKEGKMLGWGDSDTSLKALLRLVLALPKEVLTP